MGRGSRMSYRIKSTRMCLLLPCLLLSSGCTSEEVDFMPVSGLTVEVLPQTVSERVWIEPDFVLSHTLGRDSLSMLYKPHAMRSDVADNLYVLDWGDYRVKKFSSTGKLVATYGSGIGQGPGEFMSMTDVGAIGDSAFFVLDAQSSRVSIFTDSGRLKEVKSLEGRPWRRVVTGDGTVYTAYHRDGAMFGVQRRGDDLAFGDLLPEEDDAIISLSLDGFMSTTESDMIFVPVRFPLILKYSQEGDLLFARGSIDFREDVDSGVEVEARGPLRIARPKGKAFHGISVVDGGALHVRTYAVPGEQYDVVDVYDPSTGDYRHSYRLPESGAMPVVLPGAEWLAVAKDTLVDVYRIQ